MKLDANIRFVIDDEALNIKSGQTIHVLVDRDYVEDYDDVVQQIEENLYDIYGTFLHCSYSDNDDGDFVVLNQTDLCDELFNNEEE